MQDFCKTGWAIQKVAIEKHRRNDKCSVVGRRPLSELVFLFQFSSVFDLCLEETGSSCSVGFNPYVCLCHVLV